MQSEIFDKETILDLMVNFIPLGIILFFIGAFTVFAPWGFDVRNWGVMFAIMAIMFVALAILTYVSAKAIAGDEKQKPVYPQGQAGLEGAKPLHEHDDHDGVDEDVEDDQTNETTVDSDVSETDSDSSETAAEPDGTTDAETDAEADATSDTEADVDSERTK